MSIHFTPITWHNHGLWIVKSKIINDISVKSITDEDIDQKIKMGYVQKLVESITKQVYIS
jgi:hypothetical protein